MRVSADAAARFITLYVKLLYYAGQQRDVLGLTNDLEEFLPKPRLPIGIKNCTAALQRSVGVRWNA
jgi:hypothetical protein